MTQFMSAHGYSPGPMQRPVLAGTICGAIAAIPAVAVLWFSGAIDGLSAALGVSSWQLLGGYLAFWTVAGPVYGRIFMRTANDRRGGWLFGASYGFLLWIISPVTILIWLQEAALTSTASAVGPLVAHVLHGLLVGLLFPWVQSWLQRDFRAPFKPLPMGPQKVHGPSPR